MAEVTREDFTFTSSDGTTPIHAICWLPVGEAAAKPRGIVQLAHGMEEYIARYDDFARFLAGQGFAVCGNDHIGHGESLSAPDRLSYLPVNGADIMLADMDKLRTQFAARFPEDTPYIMFGHSMGSFATRCYLGRYGKGLAGAIICGTGQVPGAAASLAGWLARRQAKSKGIDSHSSLIQSLADGAYSKQIKDARTPLDWLNTDPAKVDDYIADPLCGVMFNVGGYASLMDLAKEGCSLQCARSAPSGLPILFIAGDEDPVGNNGKGVKAAYENYARASETRPQIKLYKGMRHEILNEPDHEKVYADVLEWLEEVLGGAKAMS